MFVSVHIVQEFTTLLSMFNIHYTHVEVHLHSCVCIEGSMLCYGIGVLVVFNVREYHEKWHTL